MLPNKSALNSVSAPDVDVKTNDKSKQKDTVQQARAQTVTVIDNRTGKSIEIPITDGAIGAMAFRQLKESELDFGLMIYDPGFTNIAVCRSRITFIDGIKGILQYRGYAIEQLVERSNFMEVSYLLLYGELPSKMQLDHFNNRVMRHAFVHENMIQHLKSFRYDAHPMGMLISSISAMSTFHAEANPALRGTTLYTDVDVRNKQIFRLIGKLPTIAAIAYRHRIGRPYNYPITGMSYSDNFLYMLAAMNDTHYKPNPILSKALDTLFIIHADHELNCSTNVMRHISSSGVDPYSAVAGAASALYGPLHGGANEAVVRMLSEIHSVERIPEFIEQVKAKKRRLMGFGHRIYSNYDPRAKILKRITEQVFDVMGKDPLMDLAVELERVALSDEYFISRNLYPNVDFYSGLIYRAMGFPLDMFPVLFSIPRAVGWLAHWLEFLDDPDNRIVRPRQLYLGELNRQFTPSRNRPDAVGPNNPKIENTGARLGLQHIL